MILSISENLFSSSTCSEEVLSSSQLLVSSSIQSFCAEAISFSAIFGLGVGQTLSCLVKAQSFRFLPTLFGSKASRIPLYNVLSSGFGIVAEGALFPIATNLGKTGEFQFASWQETVHGSFTIGACKAVGTHLKIGNIIVQHFVQDCAMVSVDYSFERIGFIEAKQEGLVSRLAGAELTSFRMAISAKLLANSCSDLTYIRVRQEINVEVYKSNRSEGSNHFWDPLKTLFSPALAANNGETLKQNLFSEKKPILEAKDLIHPMKDSRNLHDQEKDALTLLPLTIQSQLRRMKLIDSRLTKLADLLEETWRELHSHKDYFLGVRSFSNLIAAYRLAAGRYLIQHSYSGEISERTIQKGVEILFVWPSERFADYLVEAKEFLERPKINKKQTNPTERPSRSTPKDSLASEEKAPERINQAKKEEEKPSSHSDSKPPLSIPLHATTDGSSDVKKLGGPSNIDTDHSSKRPRRKKEPDPAKKARPLLIVHEVSSETYEEILRGVNPLGLSEETKEPTEVLSDPIVDESPDLKIERRTVQEIEPREVEPLTNPLPPKLEELKEVKIDETIQSSSPPPKPPRYFKHSRKSLERRIGKEIEKVDPDTPLAMLLTAMADCSMTTNELLQLANISTKALFKQLCGERDDEVKDPRTVLNIQKAFEKRGTQFDGARFFIRLHRNIIRLFPETERTPPVIQFTEEEFKQVQQFNLALELTRLRLDHQRGVNSLTQAEIGKKIGQSESGSHQYEMNFGKPEYETTFMKILDLLPSTQSLKSKRIAYLACRFEIVTFLPIEIIDSDGTVLRRLTPEETERFQQKRRERIGSAAFHSEILASLPEGERTVSGLANHFRSKGYPHLANRAHKYFVTYSASLSMGDLRDLCRCMGLSFRKWVLHFHAYYAYFLGTDESGNVIFPTPEEFEALHKIPSCSEGLLQKVHKEKSWDDLTLEEKWVLHLYEPPYDKFKTVEEVVEGMGVNNFRFVSFLAKNVRARLWPNESIAAYSNNLGLDPAKRRQIFIYFREEILKEIMNEQLT